MHPESQWMDCFLPQAWTQQGDRSGQVALAVPGTTVMPGAVTPDGTYALNPATGSQNPADDSSGLPLLIITTLKASQPKVCDNILPCVHSKTRFVACVRCYRVLTSMNHICCLPERS